MKEVNSTIEVVNTSESVKEALENEYRGCEVNEEECTVLINDILYSYELIKHMDVVDLSLYSINVVPVNDKPALNDELSTLFDNYSDCYADFCGESMTKETFIEVVTELLHNRQ